MFVLNSDITIGSFRFSGVNEVRIHRSIHSLEDTATIKLPAKAGVVRGTSAWPERIVTASQLKMGDHVVIKLGYNGTLTTEFEGFVKHLKMDTPLEVECEGYSYLLRQNNVDFQNSGKGLENLLKASVTGLKDAHQINVVCEPTMELANVPIHRGCGFDAIRILQKLTDNTLTCYFKEPDTLWCGFMYTAYANKSSENAASKVAYRLGYNALRESTLKIRTAADNPVTVSYSKKLPTGGKIEVSSAKAGRPGKNHIKTLNAINAEATLKKLADEKAYQTNYTGYEGTLKGFLEPFAVPGYSAFITDDLYPERDGVYLIESTEVQFGIEGARRIVEIGPKVGFAK